MGAGPSREIVLVRHGQTVWKVRRCFRGDRDPPLTALAREHVRRRLELLGTLPPYRIVARPHARALPGLRGDVTLDIRAPDALACVLDDLACVLTGTGAGGTPETGLTGSARARRSTDARPDPGCPRPIC